MIAHWVVALVSAYCTSAVLAIQSQQVNVQAWPLTASTSQPFASVAYNSTHATITSSSTPSFVAGEEVIRIGYHEPTTNEWSGVATSAANFGPEKEQTILLHLDNTGRLYHIGFRAVNARASQTQKTRERLLAEVIPMRPAPQVQMNKPVVLNADGQMAGPPEKTFLQKYWWAIAGALVLQVFLSGGGEEKK